MSTGGEENSECNKTRHHFGQCCRFLFQDPQQAVARYVFNTEASNFGAQVLFTRHRELPKSKFLLNHLCPV